MKFHNVMGLFMICVLAAGILAGCGKQSEQPPVADDPSVNLPAEDKPEVKVEITGDDPAVPLTPAVDDGEETDPADGCALTAAELKEWEAWLNARTVCELFNIPFESPGEVSLPEMFYNGVDEGNGYAGDEEVAALKAVRGDFQTDVTKVTVDDVINTFYHHFGVELTRKEIERRMEGWHYLKEYDAYYHIHGDTNMRIITCVAGELHPEDATVVLTCQSNGKTYTVGLSENKDGCIIDYIRLEEN